MTDAKKTLEELRHHREARARCMIGSPNWISHDRAINLILEHNLPLIERALEAYGGQTPVSDDQLRQVLANHLITVIGDDGSWSNGWETARMHADKIIGVFKAAGLFVVSSISPDPRDTRIAELKQALEEARAYFDQRADADLRGRNIVPNEEMRLFMVVDQALQGQAA